MTRGSLVTRKLVQTFFALVLLQSVPAQSQSVYQVDTDWPAMLPDSLIIGQVAGIAVDANDSIWVLHRPKSLSNDEKGLVLNPPISLCCRPAPSVLHFSAAGELLDSWGGPSWDQASQQWLQSESDWPMTEHGIFVDDEGFVWIGGNQDEGGQHIVVKYNAEGRHLLTLGIPGETAGSNDTARLGRPSDIAVDIDAREVFIADGYGNRRVIVFNSDTGGYKRHWGAYGNTPDDSLLPVYSALDAPSQQFLGPVHAVVIGPDERLYVADRTGNRIQVFEKDGTFIKEALLAPMTLGNGAVWDIAISPLENFRWLFIADGSNRKIWRLDRETLQVEDSFGQGGRQAGQFDWVHNVAVDSQGNLYTSEVNNGRRIQKFSPVR